MKAVGIVAEYNPFHSGHRYQIRKIREIFGAETPVSYTHLTLPTILLV